MDLGAFSISLAVKGHRGPASSVDHRDHVGLLREGVRGRVRPGPTSVPARARSGSRSPTSGVPTGSIYSVDLFGGRLPLIGSVRAVGPAVDQDDHRGLGTTAG